MGRLAAADPPVPRGPDGTQPATLDLMPGPGRRRRRPETLADFVARILGRCQPAESDCLIWTGGTSGGYPHVRWPAGLAELHGGGHADTYAHHVVALHYLGPRPERVHGSSHVVVSRLCGDPRCLQPSHLRYRSQGQASQGRRSARLKPDQVREIRARLAAGESTGAIAPDYGVSAPAVRKIETGQSWGWLDRNLAGADE